MSLISLDGYAPSLPEHPTARMQPARIQRSGGGVTKTDDYIQEIVRPYSERSRIGAWGDQPTYLPTPGDAVVRDLSMRRRRDGTGGLIRRARFRVT